MSSFPPPPPSLPPPSPPPPPPVSPQQRSGFPAWAWIVAVVVLGGGAVALLTRDGDNDETIVLDGTTIASPLGSGVPPGVVGTRDAPVPTGQVADIGLGWRLQVLDVVPDAELTATDGEFFEPAPDGFTFMLVKVALGYYGTDDPRAAIEPEIGVVGSSSVTLDRFCHGTFPDEADLFVYMFSGGVIVGNLCFVTPLAEAGTFQLYGKGDYYADENVYLELGIPGSPAEPMTPLVGPQAGALSTPARLNPTPVGIAAAVGPEWQLTVTGAPRDITNEVAPELSELAPTGFHFVGVEVTFLFNGDGAAGPFEVDVGAVDSGNVEHAGYCESTDGLEYIELSAGESTSGTLCFIVPNNVESVQLFATTFDFDGVAWFATT